MKIGIDASNLRNGGSLTHLSHLLRAAEPQRHGVRKVIIWSGQDTLNALDDYTWLLKVNPAELNGGVISRTKWQRFALVKAALAESCELLFCPGGSYVGSFHPVVTMSRNLLPFEWSELRRYPLSLMLIKLMLLRHIQSQSFRRADGLIFLTHYARDAVMKIIGKRRGRTTIIPHGIERRFFSAPKEQRPVASYSNAEPFRILYVSTVNVYKHQWVVVDVAAELRKEGFPIALELVGPAYYKPALRCMERAIHRVDHTRSYIRYVGPVSYNELPVKYLQADLFLFASSCENMPNTLLEAMASGLPITCSNRGPMPEVLGAAGVYFNPENPRDIAAAVKRLMESPALRTRVARAAFERAKAYSWTRCANETFSFLAEVAAECRR